MTVERAKNLLPVLAAFADGRTVQWASYGAEDWLDYFDRGEHHQPCIFLNPRFRWRVKPEPREWWLCPVCRQAFKTEPEYCCRGNLQVGMHVDTLCVKVREVVK